jgi:hypothetical protein
MGFVLEQVVGLIRVSSCIFHYKSAAHSDSNKVIDFDPVTPEVSIGLVGL